MKSSAFFPFFFPSPPDADASAEMTFPSVVSDLLMFAPSFRRCPVAPVEFARSDPAKSIKLHIIQVNIQKEVYITVSKQGRRKRDALNPRNLLRVQIRIHIMSLRGQYEREHGMRTRRSLVHVRRRYRTRLVSLVHERHHLLEAVHSKFRQIFDIGTEGGMFTDAEVACVLGVQEIPDFFVVDLERAKQRCWVLVVEWDVWMVRVETERTSM